jgi:hypothetical protein
LACVRACASACVRACILAWAICRARKAGGEGKERQLAAGRALIAQHRRPPPSPPSHAASSGTNIHCMWQAQRGEGLCVAHRNQKKNSGLDIAASGTKTRERGASAAAAGAAAQLRGGTGNAEKQGVGARARTLRVHTCSD